MHNETSSNNTMTISGHYFELYFEPGDGGTHKVRHTGMYHNLGLVFSKKSLNMGPIFHV